MRMKLFLWNYYFYILERNLEQEFYSHSRSQNKQTKTKALLITTNQGQLFFPSKLFIIVTISLWRRETDMLFVHPQGCFVY